MLSLGTFNQRRISGFRRRSRFSSGQAILEMSFTVCVFAFVVAVLVEGALLCTRAYAVTQLAYQGARYAAVNPAFDAATVTNYIVNTAAPSIGGSGSSQLKVTITPTSIPRTTGTPITVTVAYTSPSPFSMSSPLLGFKVPSVLSATDTAMSE